MSDVNHQEFYEFITKKAKESPQTTVAQAVSEFIQRGIKVTPMEIAKANMSEEQRNRRITAQIQQQQGTPVR